MAISRGLLPGETPIDDISGLKIKGIKTREQLSAAEAEGIRKAYMKYLLARPSRRSAKFDLPWLRRLHKEMYGNVWTWAGQFRTHDLNLGVPWQQIQERTQNLLEDLFFWKEKGVDLKEQAVRLHHRTVEIHPFLNGNGRWGRLVTNIWLKLHEGPIIEWPDSKIGSQSVIRNDYIAALVAADNGDLEPLANLHRQYSVARAPG